MSSITAAPAPPGEDLKGLDQGGLLARGLLIFIVVVPLLALLAAIPLALTGSWMSWRDLVIAGFMFVVSMHGVGGGFHRGFTHGAFRPKRPLKIGLAVAGSLAIEGPVIRWVADHRKHHKYAEKDGDPHSPWRYGESTWALLKGLIYAHIGWMFDRDASRGDPKVFAKDMLRDPDMVKISNAFPWLVVVSLFGPALVGGLWGWSLYAAATAMFWNLVRIGLMHHLTWSVNSICHVFGEHPFMTEDKAGNVKWLAFISFGESWHNLHHAIMRLARHGVVLTEGGELKNRIDINARLIWFWEKIGQATNVRWPTTQLLQEKRV